MTHGSHAPRTPSGTSQGNLVCRGRVAAQLGVIGLCAALLAGPAAAGPRIDTTGATIAPGDAASRGQVVIDESAPAAKAPAMPRIGPPGGVGSFSSAMPRFRRPAGGVEAFVAFASMELPAGEYEFASYDVAKDAVVTYGGPVTIRVGGDVTILGRVATQPPRSGALRFETGGGLSLGAGASIEAGPFQDVVIDSIGSVIVSPGASLTAQAGGVTLRAHGTDGAAADIRIDGATIGGGDVVLQASGEIAAAAGASISMVSGDVRIAAYGGDVEFSGGSAISLTAAPLGVFVEAANAIVFRDAGSGVHATSAPVRMRAFDGPLSLTAGADIRLTVGSIDLGALGTVSIGADSGTTITSGPVSVASFGGDVELFAGPGRMLGTIGGNQSDVVLSAAGHVVIDGAGDAVVSNRSVRVTAHSGDVSLPGGASLHAGGVLTVLAGGSVLAPLLRVTAAGATLGAETGTIGLPDLQFSGAFDGTGLLAVSRGTLTIGGSIVAGGPVRLASRSGSVDVSGCFITTTVMDPLTPDPGSISIESFAGDRGGIDASGANLATGPTPYVSGGILLAVHASEIVDPVDGFLVTTRASARLGRTAGAPAIVTAEGFLDTGSSPLAPGDATLTIAETTKPLSLYRAGAGRLSARGDGYLLDLRRDPAGSSRTAFRVRWTGAVAGFLTADGSGPLTIGLTSGTVTSAGTVILTNGQYRAGKLPGTAAAPDVYVSLLTGRLPGRRPGTLDVGVGLGLPGTRPATAPDVRVAVGDRFSMSIPGSAFTPLGTSSFTADEMAPGVRNVTLDFARGTLTLTAYQADLRMDDNSAPDRLLVVVAVADVERRVVVRVRRTGTRLVY